MCAPGASPRTSSFSCPPERRHPPRLPLKRTIRPTTPADAAALGRLFAEGGMDADARSLHWRYWQPRDDYPEPRSVVLVHGNDLVAHAGIIPGACSWGAARLTTRYVVDWVAFSGEFGAGVILIKQVAQSAHALVAVGGRENTTRRLLPHMGFKPAGMVTGYARPLFPLRLLRGEATWKLLPRLARAALRYSAPEPLGDEWQAVRLLGDEVSRIEAVLPKPTPGMGVTERSAALFHYLLSCPIAAMQLYGVTRAGALRGYFLFASVASQARIADCWMDSKDPADWSALIRCAVHQARQDPHAAEIVAWANDALLEQALRSCGFYARFRLPMQLRASRGVTVPESLLRVQMVEGDAPYLHTGREYWG